MAKKLSQKQKKFIDLYLNSGNATDAAQKAGYSKKTAYVSGYENLKKPQIRKYLERRAKELETKRVAGAQEVLEYFTSVMRGETLAEVVVVESARGKSKAKRFQKAPDETQRLRAAEALAKRYGLLTDKVLLEGATQVSIVENVRE